MTKENDIEEIVSKEEQEKIHKAFIDVCLESGMTEEEIMINEEDELNDLWKGRDLKGRKQNAGPVKK